MNYFKADGGRVEFRKGGYGMSPGRSQAQYGHAGHAGKTESRAQRDQRQGRDTPEQYQHITGGIDPKVPPVRRDPQDVPYDISPFITKKGILNNKKFNKFLLAKLIKGKDPLYNIYEEEGLLDEGNIINYLSDLKWQGDPAGLAKKKKETRGYTRPYGDDPRLFVKNVDQFGNQPVGPLYGTGIMDTDYLDSPSTVRKRMGVDKFGNDIKGDYLTQRERITQDLKQDSGNFFRTNALSDVLGWYNPPEAVAEDYWEGAEEDPRGYYFGKQPGYEGAQWYQQPTITKRNKELAETIGHEARHQVLGKNPEYYESIDPTYTMKKGEKVTDRHELLNRMLDFQAVGDTGIYGDIYGTMHGDMPRHLSSPIADAYSTQATAFNRDMLESYGDPFRGPRRPLFKKGGRVGFVEGGALDRSTLNERGQAVYDSMKASNQQDQSIIEALEALGLYGAGTDTGIASIVNVQPNIIDQGGGGGGGPLGTQISDFRTSVNPDDIDDTEIKQPGKFKTFIDSGINKLRESKLGQMAGSTLGWLGDLPGAGIVTGMVDKMDRFDELPAGDQAFIESMMGYSDPDTNRGNVDPFGINTRSLFGNYADYVKKRNAMYEASGKTYRPGSWQAQNKQFIAAQENERIKQEEAAKKLRLAQEAAALASAQAPSGGQWVGEAPAYTYQGQGGGEYIDRYTGQRDYHDPYDPGGGEKHGGLIGYKDGGLATMFARRK